MYIYIYIYSFMYIVFEKEIDKNKNLIFKVISCVEVRICLTPGVQSQPL